MSSCVTPIDLCVRRGDTKDVTFVWQDSMGVPIDLTNYTLIRMDVKSAVDVEPPLLQLTVGNGLTVDPLVGEILVIITPAQTLLLTDDSIYDLELTDDSGFVTTIATGTLTLEKDVTV